MKKHHDLKVVSRCFQVGDEVLVLLPVPGSALAAHFAGSYKVVKKISDTDYVIDTPD